MSRMRVLHVIPSLSADQGGPSSAIFLYARALTGFDVEITIATTDDDGLNQRKQIPLGTLLAGEAGTRCIYFRKSAESYKLSWGLRAWLREHVANYNVVHIHALFSFSSVAAAHAARRARIPYLIRPLGVLNKWGMANRRAVKSWSLRLIELPILRHAAAIHYTAEAEQREAAAAHPEIGLLPSAVIPIPVKLNAAPVDPATVQSRYPVVSGRRIILFLSRLSPKKGLQLLLQAFRDIRPEYPDAILVVAGSGEERYVESLRRTARELGCENDVVWTGFVAGQEKAALLQAAAVFVLPSFSENFGIAAAEALAAGIPCVLSEHVALAEEAAEAGAALVVPCEIEPIANALRRLLKDPGLCAQLGERGSALMRERFSEKTVGAGLVRLYERIIQSS